ncbi:urease accessory protein UreF [Opitutus terrae]|uniref:Urease accessory protein UreF n=1 Tax=Opitutus terrae (strain DSM 11246 / JCM 15787 / PB90-1) TaxID=452637 RepID=B1ZNZ8_OPITP|nr:urease accessory UreF family protein [Opitutus terrae]ACB77487.1 Urease accessory protein UreF [Opitutus terrae PB90-1]
MSSVPAIDTEPPASDYAAAPLGWLGALLQTGDSFYPTGSYAHSFGLEGLVLAGVVKDRATLRAFLLHAVWPALHRSELPLAAHAWDALGAENWERVAQLSELSSALKTAREARTAAEAIGRQRAELLVALHAAPLAREYLARAAAARWPCSPAITAALEARVLGAPCEAMLIGLVYSALAAVLSAAMKLLRLGQNGCQTLLTDMLREAPVRVAAARRIPLGEIGWFNPWLDVAAARHERAETRMFIS